MRQHQIISTMMLALLSSGWAEKPPAPSKPASPAKSPAPPAEGQAKKPARPAPPPPSASAGRAMPVAPAAVGAAMPVLTELAAQEAPGFSPAGSAFAGQFKESDLLEQPINIQAGKCYMILASGVGVSEVDLQLVAQTPPLPPVVLAQSATSGPNAVLGGKATGCWKNPMPTSGAGKVIVRARRGTGIVVGQVYMK